MAEKVRTNEDGPTYVEGMTAEHNTPEPWAPIPDHAIEIAGRPMLPERLTDIEGVPYVRCYLHGLIPADHDCGKSPGDHWCGVAAHPNQVEGEDHDDQMSSHDDWSAMQSSQKLALTDALFRAVLYLDGFIWLHDPEASELDAIKATCVEAFNMKSWDDVMDYARRKDEARKARGED